MRSVSARHPVAGSSPENRTSCIRCGVCCKKGGPALHAPDKERVGRPGGISLSCLFTIRKGEKIRDDIRGAVVPTETEIVKIKGKSGEWTCVFFREPGACGIYDFRPLECRALKCWDTREITAAYRLPRLSRADLVKDPVLLRAIAEHEAECNYERIGRLVAKLGTPGEPAALDELYNTLHIDTALRPMLVEKAGVDPDTLDFLLGRPLTETFHMFGLKVRKEGERFILTPLR